MIANIKDSKLEFKLVQDVTASWVQGKLEQMRRMMKEEKSYQEVVIDMEEVEVIDSIGISLIIGLYKSSCKLSKDFKVVGLNGRIKSLFEMMRLDQVFSVER
ncbi:MAG: STAS domain-containing protein [Clostridiales bacterium]|nr:STAS domain-containing protein [Clostridiales bacterium]